MESLAYNKKFFFIYSHYLDQGVKWRAAELVWLSKLLWHAYIITKNKDRISKRYRKAENLMVGDFSLVYNLPTMDWENQTGIILSNPRFALHAIRSKLTKINRIHNCNQKQNSSTAFDALAKWCASVFRIGVNNLILADRSREDLTFVVKRDERIQESMSHRENLLLS